MITHFTQKVTRTAHQSAAHNHASSYHSHPDATPGIGVPNSTECSERKTFLARKLTPEEVAERLGGGSIIFGSLLQGKKPAAKGDASKKVGKEGHGKSTRRTA